MLNKLLLFPFGGNAREAISAINEINKIEPSWDILGFVDDAPSLQGKEELGIKVLGGKEIFSQYPEAKVLAIPGNPKNYSQRNEIIRSLAIDTDRYATIVHPRALVAKNASLGDNCLVMANVVLSCNVSLGDHCVILSNSTVAHDTKMGSYCCIGANVVISGNVRIEDRCYIGSGTSVRENIHIESASLVGLGSVVVKDVPSNVIVAGNPAIKLTSK